MQDAEMVTFHVWQQGKRPENASVRIRADSAREAAELFVENLDDLQERDYAVLVRQEGAATREGWVVSVEYEPVLTARPGFNIP